MRLPARGWQSGFTRTVTFLDEAPVQVSFGVGSLDQAAAAARALGRRVLLVTGRHERAATDTVSADLGADLVGRVQEAVEHVPTEVAAGAVERARELDADVLLAIGGGAATGLAKAVALETGLPIVAIPTTYAGSEMTALWGVTDSAGKTTGRDARVRPRSIIYDPRLTVSLPRDVTASSGMNALAHAMEALYAPDLTMSLSEVAQAAAASLARALPRAVEQPGDLNARAELLYGAWLAGLSLGSTTMGLHHKLAHVLGGTYRLPHAGVHSAVLPQVVAYNAPAARSALTLAARALGVERPDHVAAALFDLATHVGAPTSLARLGLSLDSIDQVAASVAESNTINPRQITKPDLVRVLRDAYRGTRPEQDPRP